MDGEWVRRDPDTGQPWQAMQSAHMERRLSEGPIFPKEPSLYRIDDETVGIAGARSVFKWEPWERRRKFGKVEVGAYVRAFHRMNGNVEPDGQVVDVRDPDYVFPIVVRDRNGNDGYYRLWDLETVNRFELFGCWAYRAGQPNVPTLDVKVREAIKDLKVGEGAADIFKAFSHGWNKAAREENEAEGKDEHQVEGN